MPTRIRIQRMVWYLILAGNWVVILYFWWSNSGLVFGTSAAGTAVALGRLAGLAAVYSVLQQFFFMGRSPWLEKVFGLDKLSQWHHTNGKLSLLFIVVHPLLLVYGYSSYAQAGLWQQFVEFLTHYEDVLNAFLAVILFLVVVGTSLYIVRKKLKYESWYFVHLATYLAIFLAFGHQAAVGEDLLASRAFYIYWMTLYVLVFGSHVLFRFVRPVFRFYRHRFTVQRLERETYNVMSVYITGKDLDKFPVKAGQFMIFRFLTPKLWWQAHPFSMSKLPDGKTLRISVKELGDFTEEIKNLAPGASVLIDGPYGVFTSLFSVRPKTLLIGGGIGITPLRSLMEELLAQGKDIVFLYGNKSKQDIVFENELASLQKTYPLRIVHILSDEMDFSGEKGFVDKEKIERLVPDFAQRDVFLCGPPPMMSKIIAAFKDLKLPKDQLHFEKFSLH